MPKRRARLWDESRTKLLAHPELFVQEGKGNDRHYQVWLQEAEVEYCPVCRGKVIKVQNLYSKTFIDCIRVDDSLHAIFMDYNFYKYRCLNTDCGHIFAKVIKFATGDDRVTGRVEDEVARLVIRGISYEAISLYFSGYITKQAVGQIFNRWIHRKEDTRRMQNTPKSLAIISGKTDQSQYVLFLSLDDGIRVFDVIYGVDSANIIATVRKLDIPTVQTVLFDGDSVISGVIKDYFPEARHVIPVDYWVKQVSLDFSSFAHGILKWSTVSDKERLILKDSSELGYRRADIETLFKTRPAIQRPYEQYQKLRRITSRRDMLWVYDELTEWVESVDGEFREELGVCEILLKFYHEEIEGHANYRELVPDNFYRQTEELQEHVVATRTFSEEVLKARMLYATPTDLSNWRGIPIEDVIETLKSVNRKTGGKKYDYE